MIRNRYARYFLLAIALVVFGVSIGHRMTDHDAFFHIRCGLDMLTQGRIIMENIYSFSSPGYVFSNHAWLSKITFAIMYKFGGLTAVNLFGIGMYALMGLFLLGGLKSRRYFLYYWFLLCCGIILMSSRFLFRPQMFSYLIFLSELSLLLYAMRRNRPTVLYVLVPLQVLWNQMHAFCLLGPVLIGCFLGGCLWEYCAARAVWRARYATLTKHCIIVMVLSLVSFLCMPRPELFFTMYAQLFTEYRDFCFSCIDEFKRYNITILFAIFFLMTMPVCIRFREPDGRALAVLYVFFFVWTLTASRYISYFTLTALLTVGHAIRTGRLSHLPRGTVKWFKARGVVLRAIAIGIVLWLAVIHVFYEKGSQLGLGVSETKLPVRAVEFMNKNGISGKGFCDFAVGSYLLFARPSERVFIHNQVEAYDPAFINTFMRLYKDKAAMGEALDSYDLRFALLEYRPLSMNMIRWFAQSSWWVLVYCDDINVIFVRRDAGFERVIESYAIRDELDPMSSGEVRAILEAARAKDTLRGRLRHIVMRDNFNMHRRGSRAAHAYNRALIMGECGLYHQAERLLLQSIALDPHEREYVTALCQLYGLMHDHAKLEMIASDAARRFRGDRRIRFAYAVALFEMDDPAAIGVFDEVIAHERKVLHILVDSGNSNVRDERFERAVKYFELVLRYMPDEPDLLKTLGLLYVSQGNHVQAIDTLKRYLQLCPNESDTCLELGRQYDAVGDLAHAKPWYRRAIELKKKDRERSLTCKYKV